MTSTVSIALIAVAFILGGLLMIVWHASPKQIILQQIVYWAGVAVLILGLLLLLFPVLAFMYKTVTAAFGL